MLKSVIRRRQREWAERTAERIRPLVPLGVYVQAGGWYPGCEPMLQFRDLEWVNLVVEVGPGWTISHRYHHPEEPSEEEVARECDGLLRAASNA